MTLLMTVIVYGRFSIKLLPASYFEDIALVHRLDPQIKNPNDFSELQADSLIVPCM